MIYSYLLYYVKNVLTLKVKVREDTHKKNFFSGRTTKGVGRGNPPDH